MSRVECPLCGEMVEYEAGKPDVTCPCCGEIVVTPEGMGMIGEPE